MFGKDKASRAAAGVETLIGAQATIRGDVLFTGGLYVEGQIEGGVFADAQAAGATLTIADQGRVHGEVRAPHVIVNGNLEGDVYASERIELGPNARIHGNVHYKSIEMAAGAQITGRMVHAEQAPKQLPNPEQVKGEQLKAVKDEAA
ncbi:bactofilin family protein [Pseudomarimonas arenosa]|uniref:Polymer-forming cytoskeletal protein n=1 Tax=Pseudomarimonas arenosa TaxID=2774145 RepID=A0AAW3ZFK8_9GAMM|nr:polymer-forming cytoskeletal protein [Pseudomarimonas arenosa]MBD8524940.1 polymer-forming cytoskeletal protein [Pseudomarimonas arenosa]